MQRKCPRNLECDVKSTFSLGILDKAESFPLDIILLVEVPVSDPIEKGQKGKGLNWLTEAIE